MSAGTALSGRVEVEIEIKRSRFIALLVPVADEEAARAVIEQRRSEHPKGRHHCTAFVLGPDAEIQRTNDDGEPSGTAGRPMLEVLLGAELSDVVAIVTRYFGGVLLGAGGLTRAYGGAVSAALEQATLIPLVDLRILRVLAGYPQAAAIEAHAQRRGWRVVGAEYGAEVDLELAVRPEEADEASGVIADLSSGQAVLELGELRRLPAEG